MTLSNEMKLVLKLHQESQKTKLIFFFIMFILVLDALIMFFGLWIIALIISVTFAVFGNKIIKNILQRDYNSLMKWIDEKIEG